MGPVAELTGHRLQVALARAQSEGRVPTLAAAVVRDAAVVWRGQAGVATGAEDGVAPQHLQYRIGSITKTMTAVLLLQLRDEGRLGLNDPVSAHLPEVRADWTLRALLSHSAGIAAEPAGEWWERTTGGPFTALVDGLRRAPQPFEPGATHHYSNVGFALLGEVVARVAGRPWEEQLHRRLWEPLGLARTSYHPVTPHAQGYSVHPYAPVLTREPATDTGAMAPAGQVWSTVDDLAAYATFLLSGHPDVLSLSTLAEMGTPQAGTVADGTSGGYGLGLRLLAGGSGTLIGHTGSMPGFQASLFLDRPRRVAAVAVANSTTGLRTDEVTPSLLAVLEELEPSLPEPFAPVDHVPVKVAELLGVWHWGNTAHLFTWDGELLHMSHALTGAHAGTFTVGPGRIVGQAGYHHGEPLEVVRRADGSVSHLVASTFVFTRTPYDPSAPIPGGVPGG